MVFPQNVSLGSIPIWGLGDSRVFPSVHGLSSDEKTLIIEEIKRVDGDSNGKNENTSKVFNFYVFLF